MTPLSTKGGIALILAALLNITRMVPVFAHPAISMDNFPPHSVAETVLVTQIYGWHISHIMALISVPLFVFGIAAFFAEARIRGAAPSALAALAGISMAMVLYTVGAILDGLVLPNTVRHFADHIQAGEAHAGALVELVHLTAVSFGGFGAAVLLVSMAFVGVTWRIGFDRPIMGIIGLTLGGLSLIGFASGFLSLDIAKSLRLVGPLSLLMFVYLIASGVLLMRLPTSQKSTV